MLRELEAVEILRQVWVQQYVLIEGDLRWRDREEMPPAARLIQSPFDTAASLQPASANRRLGGLQGPPDRDL